MYHMNCWASIGAFEIWIQNTSQQVSFIYWTYIQYVRSLICKQLKILDNIFLFPSAQHIKKKNFVDELRKAVNPQYYKSTISEGAVVACIKMCKASTYVKSAESSNVLFTLVKSVVLDLKVSMLPM